MELQELIKGIKWELPSRDPSECNYYLTCNVGNCQLRLRKFTNSGCGCFSGIKLTVYDPGNYSVEYEVVIVEARPFSGYWKLNKWMDRTITRLQEENKERVQKENIEKLKALLAV